MIHLYVLSTTSVVALFLLPDVLLEASGWGAFHFLVLAFTPFDYSVLLVFSTSFYAAFLAFSSVFLAFSSAFFLASCSLSFFFSSLSFRFCSFSSKAFCFLPPSLVALLKTRHL